MIPSDPEFTPGALLKADLFGRIEAGTLAPDTPAVRRSFVAGAWFARPLARHLAAREARALRALDGLPGVPQLLASDRRRLLRTWIDGLPMQAARPRDPDWFRSARRLLVAIHRAGVTHNDLAKEPNWLVTPEGAPAVVDFQLARVSPSRGWVFRALAREDLRHLLKHKRTYCPDALTARERSLLATPSVPSRLIRRLVKPVYSFVTRRLLRWQDREGRGPPG